MALILEDALPHCIHGTGSSHQLKPISTLGYADDQPSQTSTLMLKTSQKQFMNFRNKRQ